MADTDERPSYGPLVAMCKRFGIGRTKAYELAAEGLLRTFTIGRRRFVSLESLEYLPYALKALREQEELGKSRAEALHAARQSAEDAAVIDAMGIRYPGANRPVENIAGARIRRRHRA